ncbi:hypothetical protein HOLleu_25707 [Holothuria leucospilota]|uniref:C2H2-type domain-containing protein n=1 Tax=Holothuria leucospilota TaxID=206669 RepID=A0A9Q1BSA4_HOLLE|nr:hypothetical protein HOLleu_25707 [Holothuria leucospilota]
MIWGMTLEPGKLYTEIMGEEVQLSMAAIDSRKDLDESSKSFCQIVINTNKGEYVLCTLVHGVMFQQSLDLKLMPREKVTFSVQGPSVVYLVGYTASYPEDEGLEMEDEENLEGEEDTSAWEPFDQEEDYFEQIKEEPSEVSEETSEVAEIQQDELNQEEEGGVTQIEQQEGADDMEGSQNGREEEIIFSVPDLEPGDLKSEAPTPQPDSTPMGSQMVPPQMNQQGGLFDIQNPNTRTTMPPEPSQTPDFFYPETQQPPAVPVTPPTSFQPTSSATDFQPPNPQGVLAPPETFVPPQRTMTQSRQRLPHPAQVNRGGVQQMNIQRMQAHPSRQYGTNTNEPSSKSRTVRQQVRRVSNVQSVPGTSKQDMPGPSSSSAGLEGSLPYSEHGPYDELTSSGGANIRDSRKGPVSSTSTRTVGPKKKAEDSALFDTSVSAVVCKHCGKHFTDMAKFKAHAKYHKKERRFVCEFCGKAFHTNVNKLAHERIHTGEKPFKCKVCNKGFVTNEHRRRHESTHFR